MAGMNTWMRTLVVLIAAATLLAGFLAWSNALSPRPVAAEATATPVPALTPPASAIPTEPPDMAWAFRSAASSREVTVALQLSERLDLAIAKYDGYIAFTSGHTSGSFDGSNNGRGTGLRIVDVTRARPHFNNGRPLGEDAASFVEGLATGYPLGRPELGPVTAVRLSGAPALSVDLVGPDDLVHLDAAHVSINLRAPSRLIVADIGGAIILVQIWAGAEAEFEPWLTETEALVESLRIDLSPSS